MFMLAVFLVDFRVHQSASEGGEGREWGAWHFEKLFANVNILGDIPNICFEMQLYTYFCYLNSVVPSCGRSALLYCMRKGSCE